MSESLFRIVDQPIDLAALLLEVSSEEVGAMAVFLGTVRSSNAGRRVVAVEYQAYAPMAERVLSQIAEEMRRGYGALRIAMVHRMGRLEVGQASVVVVAASAHRHEALGAVAYGIERIKQALPVWKKEFYEDGAVWLEPVHAGPVGRTGDRKKGGR